MNTTQIIIIVALGAILLALIIYALVPKGPKTQPKTPPANTGGNPTPTPTNTGVVPNSNGCSLPDTFGPTSNLNNTKVLKSGDTGKEVAALQTYLRSAGQCVTRDGIFGPQTQTALYNVTGRNQTSLDQLMNDALNMPDWTSSGSSNGASGSWGDPVATPPEQCEGISYYFLPACWGI